MSDVANAEPEERPEAVVSSEAPTGDQIPAPGDDGVTTPEPTVEIDGEQVPLSLVQDALKTRERFTKTSQELSAREVAIAEQEARFAPLLPLAGALKDPDSYDRLSQAVPGVLPDQSALAAHERDAGLLVELADKNYRLWELEKGSEFTDEQKHTLKVAAVQRIASAVAGGDYSGKVDYDALAMEHFRDDMIEREVQARTAARTAEARRTAGEGVLPPGTPPLPKTTDTTGMTPLQLMSHGHAQNAKKR